MVLFVGEKRFASAVAKRLASLAALTRGDRRAAVGGSDMLENNLDTTLGRQALRVCVDNVYKGFDTISAIATANPPTTDQTTATINLNNNNETVFDNIQQQPSDNNVEGTKAKPEDDVDDLADLSFNPKSLNFSILADALDEIGISYTDDKLQVKTFLNRILGLPILLQNELFNYFFYALTHLTNVATKNGSYTQGIGSGEGTMTLASLYDVVHIVSGDVVNAISAYIAFFVLCVQYVHLVLPYIKSRN